MWREIWSGQLQVVPAQGGGTMAPAFGEGEEKTKTLGQALLAIVLADVSMSLDNVLGVAGAARDHLGVLICGTFGG